LHEPILAAEEDEAPMELLEVEASAPAARAAALDFISGIM
jgi:hypothetical protein